MKKFLTVGLTAILVCFISSNCVFAALSDGLVASYPFDGSADDASGNSIDGTVLSGEFVENRLNQANSALSGDVEIPDNNMLTF